MILFPLFCSFLFTRISAENLSNLIVSEHWAPSHWAELGVPSSSPEQGSAVKCMIHSLWQSRQKNAHRENSHLIITRTTGFVSQGLVFVFCVVWSRVHQTQRIKTVLEQLLAQQNTVQWFVLLVHFGINKRPNEIKTKESEKGGD